MIRKLIIGLSLIALLAGAALLSGLADPLVERQVAGALIEAGVGERRAACMATRMTKRLTIAQLWKLRQGMAPQADEPGGGYGLGELIRRLDRVNDGEAVAVLTTSAGLCALGIG